MILTLQYVCWLSAAVLQASIGGVMLRRKLYREYPLFLAYTASHLVRFAILFSIYHAGSWEAYRRAYALLEVIDAVLSFAVMYELYAITFRAYEGIREMGWVLLKWAAVILAGVAVVSAASAPGSAADRFLAGYFALERSIGIVRGGLLCLLFLLHASLGLRWRTPAFGIALGFGVLSSNELVTFALMPHLAPVTASLLSWISNAAYVCAVLIWLVTVVRPAREREVQPRISGWDVEGWNRTLLELLQR